MKSREMHKSSDLTPVLWDVIVSTWNSGTLRVSQPRIFSGTIPASDKVPGTRCVALWEPKRKGTIVGQIARGWRCYFTFLTVPSIVIVEGFCFSRICHPD